MRAWVASTFGVLTPPQEAAIPRVHASEHVLISAPTGTGKTLAAFLAILSELVADHQAGGLAPGIHAVYAWERLAGWHRMVTLTMPERRDALGGPATTAPEFA